MIERNAARIALGLILALALGWRLHNIGFGLPSMYDPDEPFFMITALEMLAHGTLNPGWFGHPGSTTITLLAAIDAVVAGSGLVSGHYANLGDFARAVYADPAILFIPARVAMALIGTGCVWLTYMLGNRLNGRATGLVAAGLLAINALHISWSQIIRTDIHASLFMLASLLFAARIAERGKLRDFILAGAFAGLATATKWPAATVFVAIVGAAILARQQPVRRILAAALATIVAMAVASPFLVLDWRTVLANVSGEISSGHLGHNSAGFVFNLGFYLVDAIGGSISPDLLGGATFTVSNLGAFGIESFTPLLNVPQVAILGVDAIFPRAVIRSDGSVGAEQRIGFSLTADHRVIDGADAARYLKDLCSAVADIDLTVLG